MSDPGLPAGPARDEVVAWTTTALAGVAAVKQAAQRADAYSALVRAVARAHELPGVFELCWAAAKGIHHRFRNGPGREYVGAGVDPTDAAPSTRGEYLATAFINAAFVDDREAAGRTFVKALPTEEVTLDGTTFLFQVIDQAWLAQESRSTLVFSEGALWPPGCDFCAQPGIGAWMWEAPALAAEMHFYDGHDANGLPARVATSEDFTHWYACHGCRPYLARPVADLRALWRRHAAAAAAAGRADVEPGTWRRLIAVFLRARTAARPVRLPAGRPAPIAAPAGEASPGAGPSNY